MMAVNAQPRWKRPVYLLCSMVLWGLIGFMVQIFIAISSDVKNLNTMMLWVVVAVGAIIGYFIGCVWYRMIYIEGRRWHHLRSH